MIWEYHHLHNAIGDHYEIIIKPAGNSRFDTETIQGSSIVFVLTVNLINIIRHTSIQHSFGSIHWNHHDSRRIN